MQMTEEGLALIRQFEGFRSQAYRDAVGVWTIGFGHTAMAGPPEVKPGMTVSRREGEAMLKRDVARFADGVRGRLTVQLSPQQFSALVSFAYNVGLGNFARSSVLKAANARDLNAVPRRLALWNKAGGRVLPGLVRRRAAEGALFASAKGARLAAPPEPPKGKALARSRTVWAALLATLASLGQAAASRDTYAILLLVAVLAAAGFIIFDRFRKSQEEGV
jgi:lysozyme